MPNSQIKQGQTVHMLQIATFWDIYSIRYEDAMPEKALKYALFKVNLIPKSSFLNIFQKFLQK